MSARSDLPTLPAAELPSDFGRFFAALPGLRDQHRRPGRTVALLAVVFLLVVANQFEDLLHWVQLSWPRPLNEQAARLLDGWETAGPPWPVELARAERRTLSWMERSPVLEQGEEAGVAQAAVASASGAGRTAVRAPSPSAAAGVAAAPSRAGTAPGFAPAVPTPAVGGGPTPPTAPASSGAPVPAAPAAPKTNTVLVVGDSLAQGIGFGLDRVLSGYKNVRLLAKGKISTGLVHVEYFNWEKTIRQLIKKQPVDAVVVVVGANDAGQDMWVSHGRITGYGSAEWLSIYKARVASLIKTCQDAKLAILWVGMPSMRSKQMAQRALQLNEIYRQQAEQAGVPFLSSWDLTVGPAGEFSSFAHLPDGGTYKIRDDDGIHFNMRGYTLLARHIVDLLRTQLVLVPK